VLFRFAHFSDVHLGPMPAGAFFRDFALKRMFGGVSWALNRRRVHSVAVADLLAADILADRPDHIAFTGDLVNVSAAFEFPRALAWLSKLGSSETVTFTPGNHDTYVKTRFDGLGSFKAFTSGDMRRADSLTEIETYPRIRLRRNVAFIALNSGQPQSLFRASGALGPEQIRTLGHDLQDLRNRGFYRVVLIHHPPLPGLAKDRKALKDASQLQECLTEFGAELVLHGHNHREMFNWLDVKPPIPVHGVASASCTGLGHAQPATWHMYSVDRAKGVWRTLIKIRTYNPRSSAFETTDEFEVLREAK
jgi:3',5'-cyclic AMP phosphodiesterase CpdA